MKPITDKERLTFLEFIFYRRSLYSKLGWVFGISLLSSLVFISLPKELSIDYEAMMLKSGKFLTYVTAFFVGKYFDSFSLVVVISKLLVLWLCFYYELQLKRAGKTKVFIKNNIFGWNNQVTNTVKPLDDEQD